MDDNSKHRKTWWEERTALEYIILFIIILAVVVWLTLEFAPNLTTPALTVILTMGTVGLITFLIQQSIKSSIERSLAEHKADLEKQINEHQTKFTRLHQDRADAIAELYRLLIHAQRDLRVLNFEHPEFNSQLETTGGGELGYHNTLKSTATFYMYFAENRIYFTKNKNISEKFDSLYESFRQVELLYILEHSGMPPPKKAEPRIDQALNIVKTVIPQLREELEQEFQKLLGI
jgi:inhibitor of KinA sporulation pathway (predicted exonuclease)